MIRLQRHSPLVTECPAAEGLIEDGQTGRPVAVEWLIDSGANISTVRPSTGDNLRWRVQAIEGDPRPDGGKSFAVARGPVLQVGYIRYRGWLGVKYAEVGSDVIGMDVLDQSGHALLWDARGGQGALLKIRRNSWSTV